MPRRKKNDANEEINKSAEEFVYCGLRKCPHTECLRHNTNTPFNVLILRKNFKPDKEWNCKDIVLERLGEI